jgi:hypothetical protein
VVVVVVVVVVVIVVVVVVDYSYPYHHHHHHDHLLYSYIPQTNYVPREYSVAAILLFLFMVHTSLAAVLNLLHF